MEFLRIQATIEGLSPISFGRPMRSEKDQKETHEAFEERCWQERLHLDREGRVILPPTTFHKAVVTGSKKLGRKIPNKGNAQFTGHFQTGLMEDSTYIIEIPDGKKGWRPATAADVEKEPVFVGVNAKSTTRVTRLFPTIQPPWRAVISLTAMSSVLVQHPEVIRETLETAGILGGLARWRPSAPLCPGPYGRFQITGFNYEDGRRDAGKR